jgi:hypothetical protein
MTQYARESSFGGTGCGRLKARELEPPTLEANSQITMAAKCVLSSGDEEKITISFGAGPRLAAQLVGRLDAVFRALTSVRNSLGRAHVGGQLFFDAL